MKLAVANTIPGIGFRKKTRETNDRVLKAEVYYTNSNNKYHE